MEVFGNCWNTFFPLHVLCSMLSQNHEQSHCSYWSLSFGRFYHNCCSLPISNQSHAQMGCICSGFNIRTHLSLYFSQIFPNLGLNGVFLDFASKFVGHRVYPFLLPIVFLLLGVAFYYFQILQYRSFWSFGELKFDPELDLYHKIANPTNNVLLSIFQIIQLIWGTMFLKEAFNYLISAEAV